MDTTQTPTPPPPPPPGPTEPPDRPADYYEGAPPPGERKGCPRWIPIGCGAGGCLLLILLVGVSFWMFREGGGSLIGRLLGPLQTEVVRMAEPDVTPDQRATFEREMTRLRESLADGRVNLMQVQPVIDTIRDATGDRRVTSDELDRINELLLETNDGEVPADPQADPEGETETSGSIEL